jgi:hypothetical protein
MPLLCKRATYANYIYYLGYSCVILYPRFPYYIATLSSVTLTLSTITTYTILMQILVTV